MVLQQLQRSKVANGNTWGRLALVKVRPRNRRTLCSVACTARRSLWRRSEEDLNRVAQTPNDPVTIVADLALQGAGSELANAAVEALGGIDILVNNAGVSEIKAKTRW